MIQIGTGNWVERLKSLTEPLGKEFWSAFTPATESDVNRIKSFTRRSLDSEFLEFYRTIGYGQFNPRGYGGIDTPDEILKFVASPIFFITGSMTPGKEWATSDCHTKLWLNRGQYNPDPERFTDESLSLDGVKLYDLLQIGSNGSCCYHNLYVGPEPAPLRYCLLTDSQEMEDRCKTFSMGLEAIIRRML